jgi:hypothetical protein
MGIIDVPGTCFAGSERALTLPPITLLIAKSFYCINVDSRLIAYNLISF